MGGSANMVCKPRDGEFKCRKPVSLQHWLNQVMHTQCTSAYFDIMLWGTEANNFHF